MAFPQNDFIVSLEETNKAPQSIQPLAVVTQHDIAENSSLSNNAAPWAESPHFFQNLDLGYFSDHSLSTVENNTALMEICLKNNNTQAGPILWKCC